MKCSCHTYFPNVAVSVKPTCDCRHLPTERATLGSLPPPCFRLLWVGTLDPAQVLKGNTQAHRTERDRHPTSRLAQL